MAVSKKMGKRVALLLSCLLIVFLLLTVFIRYQAASTLEKKVVEYNTLLAPQGFELVLTPQHNGLFVSTWSLAVNRTTPVAHHFPHVPTNPLLIQLEHGPLLGLFTKGSLDIGAIRGKADISEWITSNWGAFSSHFIPRSGILTYQRSLFSSSQALKITLYNHFFTDILDQPNLLDAPLWSHMVLDVNIHGNQITMQGSAPNILLPLGSKSTERAFASTGIALQTPHFRLESAWNNGTLSLKSAQLDIPLVRLIGTDDDPSTTMHLNWQQEFTAMTLPVHSLQHLRGEGSLFQRLHRIRQAIVSNPEEPISIHSSFLLQIPNEKRVLVAIDQDVTLQPQVPKQIENIPFDLQLQSLVQSTHFSFATDTEFLKTMVYLYGVHRFSTTKPHADTRLAVSEYVDQWIKALPIMKKNGALLELSVELDPTKGLMIHGSPTSLRSIFRDPSTIVRFSALPSPDFFASIFSHSP